MQETMGQIIRRLRKERGFTQEELAETLGVTFQAISKWENDVGMPDISQVVPLAHVFGVSTDVLFGTAGTNDKEEVSEIFRRAQAQLTRPLTAESMKRKYDILMDGLELYPNNTVLLMNCLEAGLALAYPENDTYDSECGNEIYRECVRQANLVTTYASNTTDILRAHMIMVLLHSAYGNFKEAWKHTQNFPSWSNMTIHLMYAYYAHWQKDYQTEAVSCQFGIMHYIEDMLNMLANLYTAYMNLGKLEDAATTLEYALKLIDITVEKEDVVPPLHHRQKGDLYMMLADVYLKLGSIDAALEYLEKMVVYDTEECAKFRDDMKMKSPLLRDVNHKYYRLYVDRYRELYTKLTDNCFAPLKNNPKYLELLEKAEKSNNIT